MDPEEHMIDQTLERTCSMCGAQLTSAEIEASREAGGPFLCSVHAAETLPADELSASEDPE
jgi:hypothetical protein